MKSTAQHISEILGARIVVGSGDVTVEGVFTDTRKPISGGLFVALRGDQFDGDLFAEGALNAGAACAIVHQWKGGEVAAHQAVIEVPDTLLALQRLAHWWRSQLDIPVVCITGSNGKTSTKDFTTAVLSQKFLVNATKGNLNNHIGLPLTVLATTKQHTAGVFEIGMNHAGELAPLCEIARHQYGIITNIGTAHIEFLGSREAIAEEKSTVARYLPATGILFTPAACDFNEYFRSRTQAKIIPVGNGRGLVRAENPKPQEDGTWIDLVIEGEGRIEVFIPVLGKHMITNALLAAALGWKLGMSLEQIAAGLNSVSLTSGRLRRIQSDGITILDDTYNANPESMEAALDTLSEIHLTDGAQRFAVLGKMGELGPFAENAHLRIGKCAASKGIRLIAVGKDAEKIAIGGDAPHLPDHAAAAEWIRSHAKSGDVVLFKGSRSAAIEKVIQTAFPNAC